MSLNKRHEVSGETLLKAEVPCGKAYLLIEKRPYVVFIFPPLRSSPLILYSKAFLYTLRAKYWNAPIKTLIFAMEGLSAYLYGVYSSKYSFRISVGNYFLAAAQGFFRSLPSAIFLFSAITNSQANILPVIVTNHTVTIAAALVCTSSHLFSRYFRPDIRHTGRRWKNYRPVRDISSGGAISGRWSWDTVRNANIPRRLVRRTDFPKAKCHVWIHWQRNLWASSITYKQYVVSIAFSSDRLLNQ